MKMEEVVSQIATQIMKAIRELGGIPPSFLNGELKISQEPNQHLLRIGFQVGEILGTIAISWYVIDDAVSPVTLFFNATFDLIHAVAVEVLPPKTVDRILDLHSVLAKKVHAQSLSFALTLEAIDDDCFKQYGIMPFPDLVTKAVHFHQVGDMLVPPDLIRDLI